MKIEGRNALHNAGNRNFAKIVSFFLLCIMFLTALSGCREKEPAVTDYSKASNWAYFAEGQDQPVDLFLIGPTMDQGEHGYNMSLRDRDARERLLGALNKERGIYEACAVMYAPYYQQQTFPVYSLSVENQRIYRKIAYEDVAAAFEYYMENENQGRPVIMAGFSQGSQLMMMLLKEYFDEAEYREKLVAAYCIGWRVTQEELEAYPHLKMAQGASDTGVIISFNTETEGVEGSLMVPNGMKTLAINPLNWKTDSTPADKTENLGACFTNFAGEITREIPQFTGAWLDEARGTLIVPDVKPEDYKSPMFPEGIFHSFDYQFFYRNLQENVRVRVEAYLEKNENGKCTECP